MHVPKHLQLLQIHASLGKERQLPGFTWALNKLSKSSRDQPEPVRVLGLWPYKRFGFTSLCSPKDGIAFYIYIYFCPVKQLLDVSCFD